MHDVHCCRRLPPVALHVFVVDSNYWASVLMLVFACQFGVADESICTVSATSISCVRGVSSTTNPDKGCSRQPMSVV